MIFDLCYRFSFLVGNKETNEDRDVVDNTQSNYPCLQKVNIV